MPLEYAYHPGNVAHSSAPEVADTVVPAAKSLGINLIPMEGATSCGGGIIRQANRRLQLTLNARTFAIAEELGFSLGKLNYCIKELQKKGLIKLKKLKKHSNMFRR